MEGERALVIGNGRSRLRSRVLGGLQAVLTLPPTFKQVRNAQVKLHDVVDVSGCKVFGLEDRQKLSVRREHRIWPQVCRNLLRLILQDSGLRGLQIVVVLKRKLDSFVQCEAYRAVRLYRWRLYLGCWRDSGLLRWRILRIAVPRPNKGTETQQKCEHRESHTFYTHNF